MQNAIFANEGEYLNTPERRALERLLRKLLKLPSLPGVALFHSYSFHALRGKRWPRQLQLTLGPSTYSDTWGTLGSTVAG